MHRHSALIVSILAVASSPALAETFEANPGDDIESMMNALAPGDELILHGGMYTITDRFGVTLAGTEAAPIVVRAADGERPHIHRPNAAQNILDFDAAEWVIVRGIEFSGGSIGVRFRSSNDVVIEDCEIHSTADVALAMNSGGDRYERMIIRRNHIHDTRGTGEGMYLGCNNNACQFADGLLEGNYIHHTDGPEVVQGDGIEIKEGSYGNIVRDNVIHNTNYPCILTYSTVGNGAPNIIERNLLFNCGDHGIQSSADSIIRNNIILSAVGSGIAGQPHQSGAPANMTIIHNTVINAGSDALSIRGAVGAVMVANNALFSDGGRGIFVNGDMSLVTRLNNFGAGDGTMAAALSDFVDASYDGAPPMDVFLSVGSALAGAGDPAQVADVDFNGTLRMGVADVGAYAFAAGGNPGWTLAEAFKELGGVAPMDAGPIRDAGPGLDGGPLFDGGPGTDAGPGSDAGPGFDGGPGFDAGAGSDDGGCSCSVPAGSGAPFSAVSFVLVAFVAFRLRRRA